MSSKIRSVQSFPCPSQFDLTYCLQILAVTADNASSNDTQREALVGMDNSFIEENHIRCFNHTLQLSAKTLLCPFNPALGKDAKDDSDSSQDDLPDMEDDDSEKEEHGPPDAADTDNIDDNINELDNLDADAREELITDTAIVHAMVLKVKRFIFSSLSCLLISFHSTASQAVFFNHTVDHYCAPCMAPLLQGIQTEATQPSL
jgi:hypothetical protein